MAVQGGFSASMKDQTEGYNARNGAPKKVQTSFAIHGGMTDQQRAQAGVSPANPGDGPDAVSPNVLSPTKVGKRVDPVTKTSWGQRDANGKGLDTNIGGRVVGEAIISGAGSLPTGESYSTAKPGRSPG